MIVRNIPRHFVAPLSERGGCRVIPAQIVLFVAIADNHFLFFSVMSEILCIFVVYRMFVMFCVIQCNVA